MQVMGESLELVLADEHVMFLDGLSAILTQLGHRILASVSTHAALRDSLRAFRPEIALTELRAKHTVEELAEKSGDSTP